MDFSEGHFGQLGNT